MVSPDRKISILLNGGINNRSFPELVSPIIQQGESPPLIASTNTRLSKRPGTCTRSPAVTQISYSGPGYKRWGLAPSSVGRVTIRYGATAYLTTVFSDDGSSPTGFGAMYGMTSSYFPARIDSAGPLDSIRCVANIAVTYNGTNDRVWRAYPAMDTTGSVVSIHVAAWTLDGRSLCEPTQVTIFPYSASRIVWVGLTSHGALGDVLWYTGPNGICYRGLTLSARTANVNAENVVVVPGASATGVDVLSDGSSSVYLAHSQAGSASGATLRRVNVTTNTTTHSVTIAGALDGGGDCAVHYGTLAGVPRVAVAFSRVTGAKTTAAIYDATLGAVGAATELDGYGDVAVKFCEEGTQRHVMVFVSSTLGDLAGSPGTLFATTFLGTRIYSVNASAWPTVSYTRSLPWLLLQSHGVQWSANGNQYAIMFYGRSYGSTGYDPGSDNYVEDASHEAYFHLPWQVTPIARYGTVRGIAQPAQTWTHQALASRGAFIVGDKIFTTYKKQSTSTTFPVLSTGRYVVLDLSPHQPPLAHDKDGATLIAAALPVQFDGSVSIEMCGPLHAPKIAYENAGGWVLPAGSYRWCAVYQWTDAAGNTHRSKPSNIVSRTMNGTSDLATIYVTAPDSTDAWTEQRVTIVLYMSAANGTSMHHYAEQGSYAIAHPLTAFTISGVVDTAKPQIYSSGAGGEEIAPQVPPALRDIAIVGSRAWAIDAEIPTRFVYSKYRVAGVGYEFFPAGEMQLPSGAGEAMAIRDWQGTAIILAERGVYQVSGDGPNNNNSGGSFSPPVKLSEIGCSNTSSAVCFPGGIIWQSGGRFALLTGAGVDYVADYACTYDVSHAILLRRYDEVLFFSDTIAEIRVYNYARKAWSTWDSQTLADPVSCAALCPWDEDMIFLYSSSTGITRRLEADTVSTAANMVWDTDWLLLGGDFQEHVILRDVVLNGTIVGAHDVTIEVYVDYETTASRTNTWTSSQLDAIDVGGRYTVRLEPSSQNCRAVRIRVYDTRVAGEGMAPRTLTLVYATNGILYEEAFVQGSRA